MNKFRLRRGAAVGRLKMGRRRSRGAAMAEFAILAPIMVLMWMGIHYFRVGYARRLETLARAQKDAWTLAYSNTGACFRGGKKETWGGLTGDKVLTAPGGTGKE